MGSGSDGRLGNGTTNSTQNHIPSTVSGISTATQVSLGASHSCARLSDSTVKCWGYNGGGQLGDGSTTERTTPVAVSGLSDAVEVYAGEKHTCAKRSNGSFVCWGSRDYGQLGDGFVTLQTTPASVLGVSNATDLAVGNNHSCVNRSSGGVYCWGDNSSSQAGGSVAISGTVTALALGGNYSCALLDNATATCWGGLTLNVNDVTQIIAGDSHTCFIKSDKSIWCQGSRTSGALGDGFMSPQSVPAYINDTATDFTKIVSGRRHNCALKQGGTVKCWGEGTYGQLGNNQTGNQVSPVSVTGLSNATNITSMEYHTCVILFNLCPQVRQYCLVLG